MDGSVSLMARVASIPVRFGMRTSMRTTSGEVCSACSTACWPSSASPTTSMSYSPSSTI